MRTSNNQLDGNGCQYRQTFVDAAGNTHWDHIFVAQLFSNASHRPAWDFVMAAEYCAVARIRQLLAEVPMRYLKFLKTDCLGFQDLPKKFWPAVERLTRLTHPDGTPIYRCEQVEQLRGRHYEPEIAARPPERRGWERVEDPVAHCLRGRSLLLTGLPGAGKTHLARRIVEQLREAGDVVQLVSKTHCAAQNLGLGAQTADHWVRRTVRNGRCQLDWLVIEEVTQIDSGLWADVACVALDRGVRFLLLGDFRQLPAVLDSFGGCRVERPLRDCDLLPAAGPRGGLLARAHGEPPLGRPHLPLHRRAARGRARGGAPGRGGQGGPAGVPAAGGRAPRRVPGDLPRPQGAGERAGEPAPGARGRRGDRARLAGRAHDQRAADDASLARAAAGGRRRQGGQGHLRAGGRGGRGARRARRRAAVHPRGAAAAHAAVPRHHLCELPGADAPRPGVAAGLRHAALQPAAPLPAAQFLKAWANGLNLPEAAGMAQGSFVSHLCRFRTNVCGDSGMTP